jgi:hypothetical protein
MERVGVLIDRLLAQYRNNAGKEKLMITAQLLLSELQKADEENYENFSSVVSVFYPAFHQSYAVMEETETEISSQTKQEIKANGENAKQSLHEVKQEEEKNEDAYFDPLTEIPTLALKQQEINETIAAGGESLNDRLKSAASHKEIAHAIKDTPIKDLRKAIGINDRYVFISELFRGDETMYERSIKTINGFNIYGEAELWIKRELKLKLAWSENNEAVQLFDQLVKRRFS